MAALPQAPATLKSVQHHLKTALEHDARDPIVAYYCRMYVLQKGMELDRSSPEAKKFLSSLMTQMEQMKVNLSGEEAISSEMVGHAHVENYALKMFAFADSEDRAARHSKNVVKSFYTAGMLFDVLSIFGEVSEDIEKYKKYAKYKAAYIHKCLKSGMTPIPGPTDEEGHDIGFGDLSITDQSNAGPSTSEAAASNITQDEQPSSVASGGYHQPTAENLYQPQQESDAGFEVDWDKATKYTKYAMSSITYEDREAAIDYLTKSLNLLKYGHE